MTDEHEIKQRIAEAVAAEREACAKLCEAIGDDKKHSKTYRSAAYDCMGLILGRGAYRT